MTIVGRLGQVAAVTTLACGSLIAAAAPTTAAMSPGTLVWMVKDQAGGAYYNGTTGVRYALVATSAVPTLAIAGLQTADGLVLTVDGDVLQPLADGTVGTPADTLVAVVRTTGVGTWEDTSTQAQFTLVDLRDAVPGETDYALQVSKNVILTVNNELLQPVQAVTGLQK